MKTLKIWIAAVSLGATLASAGLADSGKEPPMLEKEIVIQAPRESVWHAWTSAEGLKFISSRSNVELRLGGPYEWFLDGEADSRGRTGGEGARILAFLPGEMLAFDWTFPPSIPSLRLAHAKTQVVVLLEDHGEGTRVRFVQHGWKQGEGWEEGYAYFDQAWDLVLHRMQEHLEGVASPEGG